MSTVDVVVPCYRYARFLEQCVMSVLNQVGVNVRVLIIDDASPDETPEVAGRLVREDARVTYVRHAENQGHISTYNEGIAWISSDYYLLLSADDYLLAGALARATALLDAHPGVGFVFGNTIVAYDDGSRGMQKPFANEVTPSSTRILNTKEFITASKARNIVPTPTAVVRTALQKECGGYKAEFPHAGDMEMWLRLSARSDVAFLNADQAVYRWHNANMSLTYTGSSMLMDVQQRFAVLQEFFAECWEYFGEPARIRSDCMQWLAQDALTHAHAAFNDGNRDLSAQLATFSLKVFPAAKWSFPWVKLLTKKLLGQRISTALRTKRLQT